LKFEKTVLANGIRVVTESYPEHRAAVVGAFVDVGTRDEPRGHEGMAHFIEHLVFKGTQSRSAYDIALSLEAVGGELNAFTTREHTCFHTTSLKEHLPLAIDILGDLVSRARFSKDDIDLERQVVLQEIAMATDQLEEHIFDLYLEMALGRHTLGRSILGTPQSVSQTHRSALVDFYKKNYCGRNLIISAAGNLVHSEFVDLVSKAFSKRSYAPIRRRQSKPKLKSIRRVVHKDAEQAHILLGLPSVSFKSARRFEAHIINTLLGGGMTSHLYQEVREKKGLAYSIYSYLNSFTDGGILMVYAGTDAKKIPDTIEVIFKTIRRLKKRGLKKNELEMFKLQVKGSILLGSDDLDNRMNSLGVNEMVFGSYRSVDEVIKEISEITLDGVNDFLDNYLDIDEAGILVTGKLPTEATERWIGGL
jgi:predicted Zn-dependent peptidase